MPQGAGKEGSLIAEKEGRATEGGGAGAPVRHSVRHAGRPHAQAERYGFKIIEDASHAIGGRYHCKEPVGSCRLQRLLRCLASIR